MRAGPSDDKMKKTQARLESQNYAYLPRIEPPLLDPPAGAVVAIDTETDDPTLLTLGSAWAFPGIGKVIGVSVAWEGFSAYYPFDHNEGNVSNPGQVWLWLAGLWGRADLTLVFANAAYDVGWISRSLGRYPAGRVVDVQHMAALIDEHRDSYSLDALSLEVFKRGKEKTLFKDLHDRFKFMSDKLIMSNLKFIPGWMIAPYGEADAVLTLNLYHAFYPELVKQNLLQVYELESDLIPMAVEMRRHGVRVDLDAAQRLKKDIDENRIPVVAERIKQATGVPVAAWDNEALAKALRRSGTQVGKTAKTERDQIRAPILERDKDKNPVAADVLELRKLAKISGTFLEGHIIGHAIEHGPNDWRIHANFNQLRSEQDNFNAIGGGTITGRFSCVVGETLVRTRRGEVPICEVRVGDFVWTHKRRWRRVLAVLDQGVRPILKLTLSNGKFLHCTSDHRVLTPDGWKTAGEMHEHLKNLDSQSWQYCQGYGAISLVGSAQDNGNCRAFADDRAQCAGRDPTEHAGGGAKDSGSVALLKRKDWRSKSNEGEVWESAPQLEGSLLGSQGLFDGAKRRWACFYSPRNFCQGAWCRFLARLFGGASYRWGRREQRIGQSCSGNTQRSRAYSLVTEDRAKVVEIEKIDIGPTVQVYDLMVEVDHSYVTEGVLSHNCDSPNIQQLPMRDDEFAKGIRGIFLPDLGKKYMGSADFSGQELRLMAHYACLYERFYQSAPIITKDMYRVRGGIEIAKAYNDDPRMDLHSHCAGLCGIGRYPAKTMNFRISYGAKGAAVAKALKLPTEWKLIKEPDEAGLQEWVTIENEDKAKRMREEKDENDKPRYNVVEVAGEEASQLLKAWREGMPFINDLSKACEKRAKDKGFLITLGGRRVRLKKDEEGEWIKAYKAMNSLIQGSGADQTKIAMRNLWRAGIRIQLPIHDELATSVDSQSEIDIIADFMQKAVTLEVPVIVDGKIGANLGDIDK